MKLSFLAAAALTAAATFISAPAKADGNIGIIAVTACQNVKAGMAIGRAVKLASAGNVTFFKAAMAAGYTPEEIGRQAVIQMKQWACPEALSSAVPAKPQISKEEMAKIRARQRNEQLIAARKECSNKLQAVPTANRLRVLMSECR